MSEKRGRLIEDLLAVGGAAQLIATALGFHFGDEPGSIYVSILVGVILVAPKTINRASAGAALTGFTSGAGKVKSFLTSTFPGRRKAQERAEREDDQRG